MTVLTETATSPHPAVLIRHLSKTFGANRALKDIDLRIEPGEVHVLAGANGSGANGPPSTDDTSISGRTTLPGRVSSQVTARATSATPRVRMGKWTSSSMGVATGPVVTTWTLMPSRSTSLARAAAKAFNPALEAVYALLPGWGAWAELDDRNTTRPPGAM